MSVNYSRLVALMVAALAVPLAEAHPLTAHAAAWQAFVHPFVGLDHVLAMLVVGV